MNNNEYYENNKCVVCQKDTTDFYSSCMRPMCDSVSVCSKECYHNFYRIVSIFIELFPVSFKKR